MNKQRRKKINIAITMLIQGKLLEGKNKLESILMEEQDCYDNIPENLLGSDRACSSEEAIDTLEESIDALEEIVDITDEEKKLDLIEEVIGELELI